MTRIIDQLRQLYPNVSWRYNPGAFRWECDEGWCVRAYADLSTDEGRATSDYRRTDTWERVPVVPASMALELGERPARKRGGR